MYSNMINQAMVLYVSLPEYGLPLLYLYYFHHGGGIQM